MAYALLIHEARDRRKRRTKAEGVAEYEAMQAFGQSLAARGIHKGSDALKPDTQAVTLRISDGQSQLIDGPFAEAKEMLGGFFLIDVASRAEAIALAHECPAAAWASIEIREIGTCHDA